MSWEVWWQMNRDRLLDLRGDAEAALAHTGGEGFALGDGQMMPARASLRPTDELIAERILPALSEALGQSDSADVKAAQILALARLCDPTDFSLEISPDELLIAALKSPVQEVRESAALALGVFGREDALDALSDLSWGGSLGGDVLERHDVSQRTRAFAIYGLALLGARTDDYELRTGIAWYLFAALSRKGDPSPDARIAAGIGLGLVPLEIGPPCGCGGADHDPNSSRQAQVHQLLRVLTNEKEDDIVRAHAATALAKLVAQEEPELAEHHAKVTETLLAILERGARVPNVLRQSVTIGLGQLGDADLDELDKEIRRSLVKAVKSGDALQKRYALIALAECASRGGESETEGFAGTAEQRAFLLDRLARGKSGTKPWAALALGVLGHELRMQGVQLSEDADSALRESLVRTRSADDRGALSIAIGLRGDARAGEVLVELIEGSRNESVNGYAALALGLTGAQDSREVLVQALEQAKTPALREGAAIGLALTGDRHLGERLTEILAQAEQEDEIRGALVAFAVAGGGASVDPLLGVMLDAEAGDVARTVSASSLGSLADIDAIPWYATLADHLNYAANPATLANAAGTGVLNRR